jgi:hypothetical protein
MCSPRCRLSCARYPRPRTGQPWRRTALALARIFDNPKAVWNEPAAANVLTRLLDKLSSASARGSLGGLAVR